MKRQLLISKDEVKLIKETRNLLDELLETLDIVADKESMKKLAEAKEDVKRGRLYDFNKL